MSYKIQGNYDELTQMARRFTSEAACAQEMMQQVAHMVESLENGGWVGVGAEAFFVEMRELVLPALGRFAAALKEASSTTTRIVSIFSEAENEAAHQFDGSGSGASGKPGDGGPIDQIIDWIKHAIGAAGGVVDILGAIKQASKALTWAGPVVDMIGGIVEGIGDVITGKEDFFNGMGKGVFSGLTDIGLDLVTGNIAGIVIGANEIETLIGRAGVWVEQKAFDVMNLDPKVHAILDQGLAHAADVFKGARLSETLGDVKNMVWDVAFRPGMNAINNGWQTGNVGEMMRGANMLMVNAVPVIGTFNMATNFINDPVAQQRFMQDGGKFLSDAGNLIVNLPQVENELARLPLRMGVAGFNHAVNSLPLDPGVQSRLNDMGGRMAEKVNEFALPTPWGWLGQQMQSVQYIVTGH